MYIVENSCVLLTCCLICSTTYIQTCLIAVQSFADHLEEQWSFFTFVQHCHSCIVSGLRLIHELTARKGQTNILGMAFETADYPHESVISYNNFLVDAGPGYMAHLGTLRGHPNRKCCLMRLKMLGLYHFTLIIGHKSRNTLSILNKLHCKRNCNILR